MSNALDRTLMYSVLDAANASIKVAEQTRQDALTALKLSGWGKLQKITWDSDYESDDQGGSYISTSGCCLVIDGESYGVGSNFEDFDDFEVDEDSPLEALITKYELAGIAEEDEAYKHALAELAELSFEDFERFLDLANTLVDEDKEAGEVKFTL